MADVFEKIEKRLESIEEYSEVRATFEIMGKVFQVSIIPSGVAGSIQCHRSELLARFPKGRGGTGIGGEAPDSPQDREKLGKISSEQSARIRNKEAEDLITERGVRAPHPGPRNRKHLSKARMLWLAKCEILIFVS